MPWSNSTTASSGEKYYSTICGGDATTSTYPTIRRKAPDLSELSPLTLMAADLKATLGTAFDEGAESPYELRDGVVRGLLKKLDEKKKDTSQKMPLSQEAKDCIARGIHLAIPEVVADNLKVANRVWLAGGRIPQLLINVNEKYGIWGCPDWDIFCHSDVAMKLPIAGTMVAKDSQRYANLRKVNNKINGVFQATHYYKTPSGATGAIALNIITGKFMGPEDVINSFDFKFLQATFSFIDGKPRFQVYPDAWHDLLYGIIRFTENVTPSAPKKGNTGFEAKAKRITKYVRRGFRDCTGTVCKGILADYITASIR